MAAIAAFATVGGLLPASAQITIPTVTVGNIGNVNDTKTGSLYGAVNYSYAIGTYEVTNSQYTAFLNAVAATDTFLLYNPSMGSDALRGGITRSGSAGSYTYATKSGFENKPVNYVRFWDGARFANWLNNGQGSASTETGSYTLGSVTIPVKGSVTRNAGANWVVASENEWYKAAYYDPTRNGGTGGYWTYATQTDTAPGKSPDTAKAANYDIPNGAFTDVGVYTQSPSYYGTFDQTGNLWEWMEFEVGRGGAYSNPEDEARSSKRSPNVAIPENFNITFRVASLAPIPEPSTYGAAMGVMALGVVMMRRRNTRGTI